jgi:acetylglutamate kinase
MVLAGKTNKDIVVRINQHDGDAVGLCGIDANVFRVRRYAEGGVDLGLVGAVTEVNTQYLRLLLDHGYLPVIAPLGVDDRWQVHNINADLAAASLASALQAEKLVYLSDVEGILVDEALVHSVPEGTAEEMIRAGVISKGMIPKVRSAFEALHAGVSKVHMIDGRLRHSLLLEIFTDSGIGTELVPDSGAKGRAR